MEKIKIGHLILGKSIGGVESDFSEFITYSYNDVTHYIISKSGLHPLVSNKVMNAVHKIYSLSHFANFRIPKFLIPIRTKYVIQRLKSLDIDVWLIWDTLPSLDLLTFISKAKIIFYERGKAWGKKTFKKKNYHLLLEKSNKIICAAKASKRMLELKLKVPGDKICVCLNAVRPSCKPVNVVTKNINKKKYLK